MSRFPTDTESSESTTVAPLPTGLLVGLAWGLFIALVDGLPLLLDGPMLPELGGRLLALGYLAALYGALFALAGAGLGLVTWFLLRLIRQDRSRAELAGLFGALLAAGTAILLGLHRYQPRTGGLLAILLVSLAAGMLVGWLLFRAARGRAMPWRIFRTVALVLYLAVVLAVVSVAGYRTLLRDRPPSASAASGDMATPQQPNVVLITAAGLRADHLGAYGYTDAGGDISPNIDALAGRGVRFEQAMAQSSWTVPSLASLLTSLHPGELGIDCRAVISCRPHVDEQRTTLAEALQSAGYRTAAYLTSPWLTAELGFDQGFERFESVRDQEPFDLAPLYGRMLPWILGCGRDSAACRLFTEGHGRLFDSPIPAGWGGDQVNALATQFLQQNRGERFFLWLHYTEALPPYNLEPAFRPMPQDTLANSERELRAMSYWRLGVPFAPREKLYPSDVEGLKALYDGEVHRLDRLVGSVIAQLEAQGLSDRTVVVFTSDHGQEFMDHGAYTYGHSLHSEVVRVPLIVSGPAVTTPGKSVSTPVALLDLVPTLTGIAGIPAPPEAGGRSLVPALRGESLPESPIYGESLYRVPYELKSLLQDGYKLILNVDDGQFQLYDLRSDPSEQHDMATEAVDVAGELREALLDWMAHTAQVAGELPRSAPPREFSDAIW